MATIYIENQPYEVTAGQNLLHVCLALGFDLPYFCWHPALQSVGACRQCAVKQFQDESDTQGRLIMACMTPAQEGMRISLTDPEAVAFRKQMLELLMANHPHDCPVCDEGGECHLQDMTVMTGHVYRRFRFPKRTHRNQNLGPFVNHEMNRCIACYRCVRFYREVAGGRDLAMLSAHHYVYFGRHSDGALESEFAGNLVEVCPTGVFTDKTFKRHYARPWDLQTAPSVCGHCSLGCNTLPGERYGTLRRVRNRFNREVNGYFLCDRGRFGYEFVNSEKRLRHPLRRLSVSGEQFRCTSAGVLEYLGEVLRDSRRVIGLGSPRASLEANYALRTLVGAENFYLGLSARDAHLVNMVLEIRRQVPARSPSLREMGGADAVLVLGEDVTNVAPLLALALRQDLRRQAEEIAGALHIPDWDDNAVLEAAQRATGPVYDGTRAEAEHPKATIFVATPASNKLHDAAVQTYYSAPYDLVRLGFAVAQRLDPTAPGVADLPESVAKMAERIAEALAGAEHPLIIAGYGSGSGAVMRAAANIALALRAHAEHVDLCLLLPEGNSLGLGLLGGQGSLAEALQAVEDGTADTVIVLENDLYRREEPRKLARLQAGARHVIALDSLANPTTEAAEVVLPAATFAESTGTLVNYEGRAQRFFQVFSPEGEVRESWRWLRDMAAAAGREEMRDWAGLDDVLRALAAELPAFRRVPQAALGADFRRGGRRIGRQPHRYSGRTAMQASLSVHEPQPPEDPDAPLAFSMEGYPGAPPPALAPRFWAPGWNSPQAVSKFQAEPGGALLGPEPGVRLLEPAPEGSASYFQWTASPFAPRPGEWLVIPLYHIFGTEELSQQAPAIAELTPAPYLGLNPNDARALPVAEGDLVELEVGGLTLQYPARLLNSLPAGLAGFPVGLPGMPGLDLPEWGRVRCAPPAEEGA
ncbi:MAG TPA: NADH-quinone oxidoreductase subunit NuoG [Armatimonadota bacterium]|jgi:NADH-quinone oxidoreductase subunit G